MAISRAAKNKFLNRLSLYGYGTTKVATKVAKMFAWNGRLSWKGGVAKVKARVGKLKRWVAAGWYRDG